MTVSIINPSNCPADSNADQADNDADGIGNPCDSCPEDFDPEEVDLDNDGTADACDTCVGLFNPGQADADGDGFGDENAVAVAACTEPPDHASTNDDCDDNNATVYPGAPEQCDRGFCQPSSILLLPRDHGCLGSQNQKQGQRHQMDN